MSRLKLDIFGEDHSAPSRDLGNPSTGATQASASVDGMGGGKNSGESRDGAKAGPKFVPVGFYERHLRALDDAVLELRRRGHWKASKSAIIRGLIEAHENELERFVPR